MEWKKACLRKLKHVTLKSPKIQWGKKDVTQKLFLRAISWRIINGPTKLSEVPLKSKNDSIQSLLE